MKFSQRLIFFLILSKLKIFSIFSKPLAAKHAFNIFCRPLKKVLRKKIPENALPLKFHINNLEINGFQWNKNSNKKILILHGFSSAALVFDRYINPLISKGYQVISFDAPAHGSSQGKTTNALQYSQMIEKAYQLYGPFNSFIAHSFGGISLCLAMENIKHDEQTKIVLIAPATETTTSINYALTLLKINNEAIKSEFDKIIFNLSGQHPSWFSIKRAVKNIKAKILWIHDEDDKITPISDAIKVKNDNNKNIDFLITKGLGHQKIYRNEVIKNEIFTFLS